MLATLFRSRSSDQWCRDYFFHPRLPVSFSSLRSLGCSSRQAPLDTPLCPSLSSPYLSSFLFLLVLLLLLVLLILRILPFLSSTSFVSFSWYSCSSPPPPLRDRDRHGSMMCRAVLIALPASLGVIVSDSVLPLGTPFSLILHRISVL